MPEQTEERTKLARRRMSAAEPVRRRSGGSAAPEQAARLLQMRQAGGGKLPVEEVRRMLAEVSEGERAGLVEALQQVASEAEIAVILASPSVAAKATSPKAPAKVPAKVPAILPAKAPARIPAKAGTQVSPGGPAGSTREADGGTPGRGAGAAGDPASGGAGGGAGDPAGDPAGAQVGKDADSAAPAIDGVAGAVPGMAGPVSAQRGARGGAGKGLIDSGKQAALAGVAAAKQEPPASEPAREPAAGDEAQVPGLKGKELIAAEYAAHENWSRGAGKAWGAERAALAIDATLKGMGAGLVSGAKDVALEQASTALSKKVFGRVPVAGPILSAAMNYKSFTPSYWSDQFKDIGKNLGNLDFKADPWTSTANLIGGIAGIVETIGNVASFISTLSYAVSGGAFLLTFVFPPAAAAIGPAIMVARIAGSVGTVIGFIVPALKAVQMLVNLGRLMAIEGNPADVLEAASAYQEGVSETTGELTNRVGSHAIEQFQEKKGDRKGFIAAQKEELSDALHGGDAETRKLEKEARGDITRKARDTGLRRKKAKADRDAALAAGDSKKAGTAGRRLGGAKGNETQIKKSRQTRGYLESLGENASGTDLAESGTDYLVDTLMGDGAKDEDDKNEAGRKRHPLPEPPGHPSELERLQQAIESMGGVVGDRQEKSRAMSARAARSDRELAQAQVLRANVASSRKEGLAIDQARATKEAKVQEARAKTGEAKGKTGEARNKSEPFSTILPPLDAVQWLADHCPRNPIFNVQSARAGIRGFRNRLLQARTALGGGDAPFAGQEQAVASSREGLGRVGPAKAGGDQALAVADGQAAALAGKIAGGKASLLDGKAQMDKESAEAKARRKQLEASYRQKLAEMEGWAARHRAARIASD